MYGWTEPRISFSSNSAIACVSNARIRHIRSRSSSSVATSGPTAGAATLVRLCDHRDRLAHADLVALDREDRLEDPVHGRLHLLRGLLRLDLDDQLARGDRVALT